MVPIPSDPKELDRFTFMRFIFPLISHHHSSQTTMQLYRNLKDLLKNPKFNRYEYMRTADLPPGLVINHECVKDINFIHIAMDKITDPFLPMAMKFIEQENIHRQKANLQPLAIVFQCSFAEKESLEFWGYYFHRIREHYTIYPGILVSSLPESPILGTRYVYKEYNQVKNTRFYIKTKEDVFNCRKIRKQQEDHIVYRFQSDGDWDFQTACSKQLELYKTRTFEYYDDLFKLVNKDLCKRGY